METTRKNAEQNQIGHEAIQAIFCGNIEGISLIRSQQVMKPKKIFFSLNVAIILFNKS